MNHSTSTGRRGAPVPALGLALTLALALGLAGCASAPPDRFHTLATPADAAVDAAGTATSAAATLYIDMLAVSVPEQVQRNQLVVTGSDGRIALLEHERWIAPVADEIRRALSLRVSGALGAIDVFRTPQPTGAAVYRISTDVQRFDSVLDRYALLDVVWTVRQPKTAAVLTCRSSVREQVGAGYDALVTGHRKALDGVSVAMATAVRGMAAGGQGACPGAGR